MNRKNVEILLSQNIKGFSRPSIQLEQYMTPPRVAANLIQRAFELGDINDKRVVDLCAGTGMLSAATVLYGGSVTAVEVDEEAIKIFKDNFLKLELECSVIKEDALIFQDEKGFDTAILNPPFGIQQKKYRDSKFIIKAHALATVVYSIVDGSPANKTKLPIILKQNNISITEMYEEQYPLSRTYAWHKSDKKVISVFVIRSVSTILA